MQRRGEELEIHISPGWGQVVETLEENEQKLNRRVGQSPDWRGWNSKLRGSEVPSVGQEKVSQSLAALYLICFLCLCECLQVCNCAACTRFPWRPEEGAGSLGTQVPHGCELPGGCWDLAHGTISPAPHFRPTSDRQIHNHLCTNTMQSDEVKGHGSSRVMACHHHTADSSGVT